MRLWMRLNVCVFGIRWVRLNLDFFFDTCGCAFRCDPCGMCVNSCRDFHKLIPVLCHLTFARWCRLHRLATSRRALWSWKASWPNCRLPTKNATATRYTLVWVVVEHMVGRSGMPVAFAAPVPTPRTQHRTPVVDAPVFNPPSHAVGTLRVCRRRW